MLNVEHHSDFGKKKIGLVKLIHMVGFSGILDIGKKDDFQMIKNKLMNRKELLVDLKVF